MVGGLLVGGILLISLKNIFTAWIDTYCFYWFLSIYRSLSRNLLNNYYNRGLLYIKSKGSTTLTYEVNSVCYEFAMSVLSPFFQMIGKGVLVLLLSVAFFIYSPFVALFFLFGVCLIICFYIKLVRNRVIRYGKEENRSKKKQWRNVRELFHGYVEIETNQAFDLINDRFEESMENITYCRKKAKQLQQIPSILLETGMVLALFALFLMAENRNELILLLGAFTVVGMRIIPSIQSIISCWAQIQNYDYTIDIVAEAMAFNSNRIVRSDRSINLKFENVLVVDGISFAYNQGDYCILNNLSIQFQCGEFVGIQGLSGVGKSTFMNLLSGFIQPGKGQILIDYVPLSNSNVKEWQRMIGYVPQEIFIMDGTIAENIALGVRKEHIDNKQICEILKQLSLDKWVNELPLGVDTFLGENGNLMSGGQKQRIGIARTLYKKASVLLFDEATSALDSQTEEELLQTICQLPKMGYKITIVMIAHRQSSLTKCDRIIKL